MGTRTLTDSHLDLFELRVPPKPEFLSPLRLFIFDLARQVGFPDSDADLIALAADEALANSVRHTGRRKDPLEVKIRVTHDALEISIRDDGQEYFERFLQPVAIEDHLAEMRNNGLGLHIIKTVMDTVEYVRTDDSRNVLTLVKYLPGATPPITP